VHPCMRVCVLAFEKDIQMCTQSLRGEALKQTRKTQEKAQNHPSLAGSELDPRTANLSEKRTKTPAKSRSLTPFDATTPTGGWFRFYRKFLTDGALRFSDQYSDIEALIWMCGKAVFTDYKRPIQGRVVWLRPGQLVAAHTYLMEVFGWSKGRLTGYLDRLERIGYIRRSTDQGITVITLCDEEENFERTQTERPRPQPTSDRKKSEIQTDNKNKKKEEKKQEDSSFRPTAEKRSGSPRSKLMHDFPRPLSLGSAGSKSPSFTDLPAAKPSSEDQPFKSAFTQDLDGTMPEERRQSVQRSRAENPLVAQALADAQKSERQKSSV
jgi:hypothetical protein